MSPQPGIWELSPKGTVLLPEPIAMSAPRPQRRRVPAAPGTRPTAAAPPQLVPSGLCQFADGQNPETALSAPATAAKLEFCKVRPFCNSDRPTFPERNALSTRRRPKRARRAGIGNASLKRHLPFPLPVCTCRSFRDTQVSSSSSVPRELVPRRPATASVSRGSGASARRSNTPSSQAAKRTSEELKTGRERIIRRLCPRQHSSQKPSARG